MDVKKTGAKDPDVDKAGEAAPAAPESPPGGEQEAPAKESVQPGGAEPPLPSLDFSTFILSLSSSVLMNLGVVENPVTKKKEKEPAVAKQTIELITLLKEKTTGNLTEQEAKLLDDILHELHLWYVKEAG
jgi:hypothetical protein